jgi:general secretion pathway protein D
MIKMLLLRLWLLSLLLLLPLPGLGDEQTWTVNFKNSDIQEVIKFVADATGKTMVVDPVVKGPVKVITAEPLNRAQLYDLFLSVLAVHGYTAVDSGGVVRILPAKEARSSPGSVTDELQGVNDSYTTQVIQLHNIAAGRVLPVLRPLVPQESHIAAYDANNSIIISATAANIARIRQLIARIDKSALATTEMIELQYSDAAAVVRMLEQLQQGEAGQGTQSPRQLKLVADQRTNTVLISGADLELQRIKTMVQRLDRPGPQSGNVRVVYLEYASARNMSQVLNSIVQNMQKLSPGESSGARRSATIEADEETNSLLITAELAELDTLMDVIKRLDIRRAQVLVEAIIVEMENIDGRKLGVQWMFQGNNGGFGSSVSPGSLSTSLGDVDDILPGGDDDNSDTIFGTLATISGQTLGVGRVTNGSSFLAILNALQEETGANILSTPNLLTLDNHAASITVGQNVPFLTGSYTSTGAGSTPANPFQTIERESVGISLKVTPHINEGDSIVLDVVQEVSSLTGTTDVDVVTNERRIDTQILVAEGQTVVLGGLIKDEMQESEQRVPFLGSIPILGRAFRNTSVKATKSNLMVFIRATVVRDVATLTGATAEKYRYIRGQQMKQRERGALLGEDSKLPVLPELAAYQQSLLGVPQPSPQPIDLTVGGQQ